MAKGAFIGVPTIIPASTPLGNKAIGDIVKLNVGGVAVDFIVVNQGNPDATMYDEGANGTWLLMKDLITKMAFASGSGKAYIASDVYPYVNDTIFSLLDSDIQSIVKEVGIPTTDATGGALYGGTRAKAFILSRRELGNTEGLSDGAVLKYFEDAETNKEKRIAYYEGRATVYQSRTKTSSANCWAVSYTGAGTTWQSYGSSNHTGVRPALVLPSDIGVEEDGTVTALPPVEKETIVEVARKVKKMFVGVNGIARKVKKAWIGINGIARLFFSGGELSYYGTAATPLSLERYGIATATIGNHALFGGGYGGGQRKNTMDAYDDILTRTNPTALSSGRAEMGTATVGNYAIFAGGHTGSGTISSKVEAYDLSLTRSTPTALSKSRQQMGSAVIGNYALFGGGNNNSETSYSTVDVYDASLTRTTATALSNSGVPMATSVGNYALFTRSSMADAYNASLTKTTTTVFGVTMNAATTVGNYALFGGHSDSAVTYVYDASLTLIEIEGLSVKRVRLAAATLGEFALFAGGQNGYYVTWDVVDVYDANLTRTVTTPLSIGKACTAAAVIGDYVLFGGGISYDSSGDDVYSQHQSAVDVYQVS